MATSRISTIPAPIGGLNAKDGIATMPPTDAVALTNWFPTPSTVNLRNGSASYATGLTGNVETLAQYGGTGGNKLFAAANYGLYDISAAGSVGAPLLSGLSLNRWQSVNFGSTAANGQFLFLANGADAPAYYDGSTWAQVASTSTAQTISNLTHAGTTAVATTSAPHGLGPNVKVTVSGASPAAYNGTFVITPTSLTTFTYVMASDPGAAASPAGSYVILNAITGVNPNLFIQGTSFKQRLYWVESGSFRCWYLGVNAISGAAASLDFGGMFKLGGYLMAVATWSVDDAAGMQEYFVAISSLGEVVVYQGYDPTNAANWTISAHFRIGRPIGRRCFCKLGSDLIFITADGAYPLSKALLTDRAQEADALTDKIQNLVNGDVQAFQGNFGWQIILYPIGNKVILNVPNGYANYQYVMNTITGAWCKFTGWNAQCWGLYNDGLYFGGSGAVYQADTGYSDAGNTINADAQQAFNYFGVDGLKYFTGMRPVFYGSSGMSPSCAINVDFDTSMAPSVTTGTYGGFTPWGSAWGSSWTTPNGTVRGWHGAGGFGYTGAPHIAMNAKFVSCQWQSTDVIFQAAAPGYAF